MKNPRLVYELVSAVVKAIEKPVTVKIRKGFDDEHVNAVEIAKIIEEAGASAVAVHGRTREQYYSGKADWEIDPSGQRGGSHPGHRQRRRDVGRTGGSDAKADRMRRHYDRPRGRGESVDLLGADRV